MRSFALIGSRDSSDEDNEFLYNTGLALLRLGLAGYSGGAKKGPDHSFTRALTTFIEEGGNARDSRIYLPALAHPQPKGNPIDWCIKTPLSNYAHHSHTFNMCVLVHPVMHYLPQYVQQLHCRNVFQILGDDLESRVAFVLTSARMDGKGDVVGGTATAIKIAMAFGVPIFNIRKPEDVLRLHVLMAAIAADPINFNPSI